MNITESYGGYMIFNAIDGCTPLPDESDEKLLTPKEAAKFLNVSLRTIWEWKGRKIIPYYEFGGFLRKRIRFHRDELLAFGKKNAEQSTSKSPGGPKNED